LIVSEQNERAAVVNVQCLGEGLGMFEEAFHVPNSSLVAKFDAIKLTLAGGDSAMVTPISLRLALP
jgi:hypothetical protein